MGVKEMTWIEAGYQTFALEGPKRIKIERLANQVQKNKSSFYHYFADLELFTEHLLDYHLKQAWIMVEKEEACNSLDELISVILDHKIDLLFNRQLRIHRENPNFSACFEKTYQMSAQPLIGVWAKILHLDPHSKAASMTLKLGIENFYVQITPQNLTHTWLLHYFGEFKRLVKAFKQANNPSNLNGTV